MKTKQKNVRLKFPYIDALKKFDGEGATIIHQALDNSPHQPFLRELAKQKEAYGRTKDNQEDHPDKQAISGEFESR